MKIILSRKGFDSSSGGVPSPILPDGTLQSLPIPKPHWNICYEELSINGQSLGPLIEDLTNKKYTRKSLAHLDPDLRSSMYPRDLHWRPIFGQTSVAQSHLAQMGVTAGDLFLFFGWFRQTECIKGKYRFVKNARDLHITYGWLQIGEIINIKNERERVPSWALYHPHLDIDYYKEKPNNTLYLSSEKLQLQGLDREITGGGVFEKYCEALQLTAPDPKCTRTVWQLPNWCYPRNGCIPLSYHSNIKRWKRADSRVLLCSVGRGQEFVLDADDFPEAIDWVSNLMNAAVPTPKT